MKYNALRALCDAKDNIDIKDSNLQRAKKREVVRVLVLLVLKGDL